MLLHAILDYPLSKEFISIGNKKTQRSLGTAPKKIQNLPENYCAIPLNVNCSCTTFAPLKTTTQ